jgi:hypothetical protein
MAPGTNVIGPLKLDRTQGGEQPSAAAGVEASLAATRARYLGRMPGIVREQLAYRLRAGAVHRSPHHHFDGFQIQSPGLAPAGEDYLQQAIYFLRDFLLDLLDRFFSSGVRVSSTGRSRQIFSLTSRKARWTS